MPPHLSCSFEKGQERKSLTCLPVCLALGTLGQREMLSVRSERVRCKADTERINAYPSTPLILWDCSSPAVRSALLFRQLCRRTGSDRTGFPIVSHDSNGGREAGTSLIWRAWWPLSRAGQGEEQPGRLPALGRICQVCREGLIWRALRPAWFNVVSVTAGRRLERCRGKRCSDAA